MLDYNEDAEVGDEAEGIDCCGIREIVGVQNIKNIERFVLEMADKYFCEDPKYDHLPAFIFFSTIKGENGHALRKFIEKNKLGEVLQTRPRKNLNTGNMLTMWTWGINKKSLKLWWVKNIINTDTDDLEDEDE